MPPFNNWIIDLLVCVEQHLRLDDVEFIARATVGYLCQFTFLFTVVFREHHLGWQAAATPSCIQIISFASLTLPNQPPSESILIAHAFPVPPFAENVSNP